MKTNTANHRKHKKQDSLVLTNKQDDLKTFDIQNKLNEAVLWTLWHRINYYVSLWHLISTKCVLMPTFSPNLNPLPFSSYHSYYPLSPALLSTFPFIAPRFSSTNFKSIQHRPFPLTPPFFCWLLWGCVCSSSSGGGGGAAGVEGVRQSALVSWGSVAKRSQHRGIKRTRWKAHFCTASSYNALPFPSVTHTHTRAHELVCTCVCWCAYEWHVSECKAMALGAARFFREEG